MGPKLRFPPMCKILALRQQQNALLTYLLNSSFFSGPINLASLMSWQPDSMGEERLHSLASSLTAHSLGLGSDRLRMAKDYCTSPPPLLHEYSRIGQLWVVHSRICTSSVKILRTIFQIMENVETSCPHAQEIQLLKPCWEIDYSKECNMSPTWLVFKASLVIQILCRLQGCLGMVLLFSCQGFLWGAEASATVPAEFFLAPKYIYLVISGTFRLYAEC